MEPATIDETVPTGTQDNASSTIAISSSSTTGTNTTPLAAVPSRRHRYTRSSTSSVTQLLSDSCNSLLQKFRRNPSEKPDKRLNNRFVLSPSKSTSDVSDNKKPDSMTDKTKRGGGDSSLVGSYTSSALDRLRNNLSPVSSYYKPLMRTFGKRDESPKKKEEDKDKTPVPPAASSKPQSTISRLETKYSDVLDRFAKRRGRRQEADRDKTLEPEKSEEAQKNPLMRSATGNYLNRKERTPFRMMKNKSRYPTSDLSYNQLRSELGLMNSNTSDYSSRYKSRVPVTSYEPTPRYKDTIYDSLIPSTVASGKKTVIGSDLSHRSGNGLDYGLYDGNRGKENVYKSKYDPDALYAEINNNDSSFYRGAGSGRKPLQRQQMRSFRRRNDLDDYPPVDTRQYHRHATNYRALDLDEDRLGTHHSSAAATASQAGYGRRAGGLQRSRTQNFNETDYNILEDDRSSADVAAIIACLQEDNNDLAAQAFSDRMARRKEIQGLIKKYAGVDDDKSVNDDNNNVKHETSPTSGELATSSSVRSLAGIGGIVGKTKIPTTASTSNLNHPNAFLPLSKTQSYSIMSSYATPRSRIPKTFLTFDFSNSLQKCMKNAKSNVQKFSVV